MTVQRERCPDTAVGGLSTSGFSSQSQKGQMLQVQNEPKASGGRSTTAES